MQELNNLEDVIEVYSEYIYDLVRNELNLNYECNFTEEFYRFVAKATGAYVVYKIQSEDEFLVELDMDYINEALEYFEYSIEECDVNEIKVSDLDDLIADMIEDYDNSNEYKLVNTLRDFGMYLIPTMETEDNYNLDIETANASLSESVEITGMHPYVTAFAANIFTLDDERIPGIVRYDNGNDDPLILILA